MKPGYWPETPEKRMSWMLEEMGEVLQAKGKLDRFGGNNINPDTGYRNCTELFGELNDLVAAITAVKADILDEYE